MKIVRVVLAAPRAPDAPTSRDLYGSEPPEPGLARRGAAPGPGADAVLVDVLRATTTLTVALDHGARNVIPAATVAAGFAARARHPGALLCGERDGRVVPGFDLGNSPLEYEPARVAGRTLIFASTNGSQSLELAARARRRVLGAFVNATAAARAVAEAGEVWIVASGKLGRFALEDAACAGWIAAALAARGFTPEGAATRMALALAPRDARAVREVVEGCAHGRYLRSLGGAYARDLEFCARLDTLDRAFAV